MANRLVTGMFTALAVFEILATAPAIAEDTTEGSYVFVLTHKGDDTEMDSTLKIDGISPMKDASQQSLTGTSKEQDEGEFDAAKKEGLRNLSSIAKTVAVCSYQNNDKTIDIITMAIGPGAGKKAREAFLGEAKKLQGTAGITPQCGLYAGGKPVNG